jgi:hypothetical protein
MNARPMQCDCGSTNISVRMHVGCDIDPSGEEQQHLDTCMVCGKTRLWGHRWEWNKKLSEPKLFCGTWRDSLFGSEWF